MEHIIYLDNSATTKPSKTAVEYINKALTENWGNPSSLHSLGFNAEILVQKARSVLSKFINARDDEIFFTSCGTESNNTAIMSALHRKNRGNRIITTKIEHPSVLQTVKRLENDGFEVIYLDVDSCGQIDLSQLREALNDKTVLVSIMLVNNEIGTIEPIKEAVKLTKELSPNTVFHCDGVQGFGKIPINIKDLGVDMLSASAHKIGGSKGIGLLYCKKGLKIAPLLTGGGQEKGLRSGTEAVPLIAGFSGALKDLGNLNDNLKYIKELNAYARESFADSGFIEINSPENALEYILNISVVGYRSETLLHFLESRNIFVSSGSACAKGETSYVLGSVGLPQKRSDSALRLSFSKDNTKEDIRQVLEALRTATRTLRPSKI